MFSPLILAVDPGDIHEALSSLDVSHVLFLNNSLPLFYCQACQATTLRIHPQEGFVNSASDLQVVGGGGGGGVRDLGTLSNGRLASLRETRYLGVSALLGSVSSKNTEGGVPWGPSP